MEGESETRRDLSDASDNEPQITVSRRSREIRNAQTFSSHRRVTWTQIHFIFVVRRLKFYLFSLKPDVSPKSQRDIRVNTLSTWNFLGFFELSEECRSLAIPPHWARDELAESSRFESSIFHKIDKICALMMGTMSLYETTKNNFSILHTSSSRITYSEHTMISTQHTTLGRAITVSLQFFARFFFVVSVLMMISFRVTHQFPTMFFIFDRRLYSPTVPTNRLNFLIFILLHSTFLGAAIFRKLTFTSPHNRGVKRGKRL